MTTLTPEQRQAIEQEGSVKIQDPETQQAYILIKEELFQRMQALLSGPLSIAEQRAVLAHVGKRAGWDDPALDVYNALDPRK